MSQSLEFLCRWIFVAVLVNTFKFWRMFFMDGRGCLVACKDTASDVLLFCMIILSVQPATVLRLADDGKRGRIEVIAQETWREEERTAQVMWRGPEPCLSIACV